MNELTRNWTIARRVAGCLILACSLPAFAAAPPGKPAASATAAPATPTAPPVKSNTLPVKATAPRATLAAFANEQELRALLNRWRAEYKRRGEREYGLSSVAMEAAPAAAAMPLAKAVANGDDSDAITNLQHAGVDEGGIVKAHGDYLIILRRGRLFTVRIGDDDLRPISSSDAFGPDVDPRGAWYDEILTSGNTVAVIGYSYERGGTEIGLFELGLGGARGNGRGLRAGELVHKGTYHLRSNDYYSSRNYASRLIGSKLVFYTPMQLNLWADDPWESFPAMRRWHRGALPSEFKRIAPATRIYRTDDVLDPHAGIALHTVTVCELAQPEMSCESTAVLGPDGRVFYVSPNSVFVWVTPWHRASGERAGASLFRIPLDGSAPSALKVAGSPVDQFSFLEGDDGMLNVLVRSEGGGEGMWAAETSAGDLALLRVGLATFGDGRSTVPASAYLRLPRPEGWSVQNRYVGSYLLYGAGSGWHRPSPTADSEIFAVRYVEGMTFTVPLPHAVDRIEALGSHALAVGSDGKDLHLTSLRLARYPAVAHRLVRTNAAQGETRSHGFFYKPSSDADGLLGLPIVGNGEPGSRQLRKESAALLYLRNSALKLSELGTLDARSEGRDDGCRASCVDWYGNSRPLFLRGRVFALLGYEIVEGQVGERRITETRRINFAPGPVRMTQAD